MGGGALIDQAFKRLRIYVYVFEMLLLSKKEMVLLHFALSSFQVQQARLRETRLSERHTHTYSQVDKAETESLALVTS